MKKRITSYVILSGKDWAELEGFVNNSIADGWQPLGGVASDGKSYSQAMVKYED